MSDAEFLTALAACLVAMAVIDPLIEGETVVVHNANELLAASISEQAASKSITTCFVAEALLDSCISLAPYMTQSEVAEALPENPACFVGLSNHAVAKAEVEATILSVLPAHCRKETASSLYSAIGVQDSSSTAAFSAQWLQRACSWMSKAPGTVPAVLVGVNDLIQGAGVNDPTAVVDWTQSESHSVHLNRLDSAAFFKQDKTYWMCGLSGALGVSLCDWMIERGARYLVLTSRNPNISPDWIAAHRVKGVYVTIVPCDVTDAKALRAAHEHIVATLPPIIGVLNGAMVLRDVSIANMSFEQMSDVFRPKVYGSINLDAIFHDTPLDFFILFSSINCVIGNLGQANYSAVNTFMCSLAAQRRARGLAATALNVGAIIGAGYTERESSKALDLTVSKMALMHLSEQDYHQLFTEGIDAGQPDSGDGAELTTGLLDIPADDGANAPRWQHNPTFSHFLVHQVEQVGEAGNEAVMSVKDQVAACKNAKDILVLVKRTLAAQLRNVLQMTSADDDLMAARSSDIGLDSLISVDIRSWILKNFEVRVPVLKIMGNDTMADIAELVVEQVPSTLLGGSDAPIAVAEPVAKPAPAPAIVVMLKGSESNSASTSTVGDSYDESVAPTRAVSPIVLTRATTPDSAVSPERKPKRAGDINWDTEIVLPKAALIPRALVPASPPRRVVLTGVSGLLARQMLEQLLLNKSVDEIICIATRRLDERLASRDLPRDARISYFAGDLEQPRLGLSVKKASAIFSRADVVIHNAADTSHLKFYPAIRAANTGSTRELISLCMNREIPVHYLSTLIIFHPADGSHGYVAAKWASERLLEEYSAQHGAKTWIHRPSTIMRSGKDATNAAAQIDWMNALVSYMNQMKAVPTHSGRSVFKKTVASDALVSYVHQVGTMSPPLSHLKEFVQGQTSAADVQVLPVAQWGEKAVNSGLHPGIAALIESMDDPGQPHYPRKLKAAE
ncbi:hypothetical protein CLAFUW4_14084 [Fulvia fulva]|uniref:uncharacterized protein n=1 Tax=Passalora fulva TaxID=5499 RepID=UPI002852679D|nr:uncharacterized protein CLAFUR5_20372 [Fulvia fulva]KAK4610729.1 hypothetical protein CLAFUR4_14087 [Fulvia fulva]KAK4610848.1 hypothetical protein CLAFUR0_14091 [Fulvia fulva]WMI39084.1 hypothetical protein CLAFUR5_20372 [Fulvia fulva]WPV21998.1 hypothetical protein CLAFUW4_14084 [Fulvia fulva]WPV37179.1 hypothetical protein CLAFUW7_14095 [Fulvia fulva]